jgi:DNA (cytosine-5)-methyltransferase 1
VINSDVNNLDLKDLGPIDGFSYGFPCNDFSQVGESRGLEGKFGGLYRFGVHVLETFSPQFFVAENVGGLRTVQHAVALKRICRELSEAGPKYNLTVHFYRFEEYGIPQTRHRIIIVGVQKDLKCTFKVPAPTFGKKNFVTSRSALEYPPIPDWAANNDLTRQGAVVVERLKHIKPGENAWTANLPQRLRLRVKGARLSQIYRRLDPDKPAYTITGSGGGGTHVYHWTEPRALTNRERARLQCFPDTFEFAGSRESVRRQIGMAVPPMMAKAILTAVLKTLHGIPYNWVPANLGGED